MNNNLSNIQEYYEEVGALHDVSFEEFKVICKSPFRFIKESMSSGVLKDIRLKYFGIFKISKGRLKYFKNLVENKYKKGEIGEKKYAEKMKIYNSYE